MAKRTQNVVSEEEVRAEAVRELAIEDLSPDAQEEILAIVQATLMEHINIAVMKALGPEGMMALGDTEGNPEALDKKLAELLPNVGEVVKGAVEEALKNHRALVADVRKRFGASTATAS